MKKIFKKEAKAKPFKQMFEKLSIRWVNFPDETITTNWDFLNNTHIQVTLSEYSSGLIPIDQVEVQVEEGEWIPLTEALSSAGTNL